MPRLVAENPASRLRGPFRSLLVDVLTSQQLLAVVRPGVVGFGGIFLPAVAAVVVTIPGRSEK